MYKYPSVDKTPQVTECEVDPSTLNASPMYPQTSIQVDANISFHNNDLVAPISVNK